MEHELEMARQLQASLIPQAIPQIAGWEFQARWYPARQVSGDYFDFVNTSQLQRFLIADVSDKGMSAALFMALTRSTLRASITDDQAPATILTHANRLLCVDTASRQADRLIEFERTGPALGILNEYAYTQQSVRLEPGDFILFFTDGVTDALNPAGEDFGEERLRRVIIEHRQRAASEIVAALEHALWSFTDHQTPADDVTIVLVKRL